MSRISYGLLIRWTSGSSIIGKCISIQFKEYGDFLSMMIEQMLEHEVIATVMWMFKRKRVPAGTTEVFYVYQDSPESEARVNFIFEGENCVLPLREFCQAVEIDEEELTGVYWKWKEYGWLGEDDEWFEYCYSRIPRTKEERLAWMEEVGWSDDYANNWRKYARECNRDLQVGNDPTVAQEVTDAIGN